MILGRSFCAIVSTEACMLQRDRWSASQPTIGPGPMSNGCALIVIDVVARAPGIQANLLFQGFNDLLLSAGPLNSPSWLHVFLFDNYV